MCEYDYIITPSIIIIGNACIIWGFYILTTKPFQEKYFLKDKLLDDVDQFQDIINNIYDCLKKESQEREFIRYIKLLRAQLDVIKQYNKQTKSPYINNMEIKVKELDNALTDSDQDKEKARKALMTLEVNTLSVKSLAIQERLA